MRTLVWFRSDLRARDNTALTEACRRATSDLEGGTLGVFTICAEQWREHDWAPVRVDLLLRSLEALKIALAAKGIPLRIVTVPRFKGVPAALSEVATTFGCGALYMSREYEWNEQRRDEAVAERFAADDREVHAFDDQVIFTPGSIRSQQGTFYSQFSAFKRAWLAELEERGSPRVLPAPRSQPAIDVPSDIVPAALAPFAGLKCPDLYPAGEELALARLRAFARDRMSDYGTARDRPGIDGTSGLSPYLNLGVVSARQCLSAALKADTEGSESWLNELIWREFYKHLLVGFPRLSKGANFKAKYDAVPWETNEEEFQAWCAGKTGYPIVDAGMRQLLTTGWMHNRVRMICAMFLTKHLLSDWRWGERFFMQHLVDGDLAANNGGWQWSSSTGTDAQPYFRVFNPWLQSKRFDPEGVYVKRFVPELRDIPSKALHDATKLAREVAARAADYPPPLVEHRSARERAIAVFKGL